MIRIYLDSNIFRYIKPSHPTYNKELHELMDKLKDDVLFIYSGAHLDDLKDSTKEFIEEDLSIMTGYVKDNYFYRDSIKNETHCDLLKPLDAYKSIDYGAMNRVLKNPFDFDDLFKELDDTEEGKLAKKLIENVFNKPLSSLGDTITPPKEDDPSKQMFDKMFPGYSPDMSLKDFMRSIGPYTGKLLNDSKEVTEMRNYLQDYLESETYSFKNWGMEFNERFKDKLGKTFIDIIDGMLLEKQKADFFIRFNYAYTLLEIFNITQERSGNRAKKFTYWSLTKDSEHGYFASMCDYLVSDDKGLQVKAHIVYSLFGISTRVLSTKDFVEIKDKLLSTEKSTSEFLDKLSHNIKNSVVTSIQTEIETRNTITHYELDKPHFNLFEFMQIIQYQNGTYRYILSLAKEPSEITLMNREIELIISKLNKALGQDDESKGEFRLDEEIHYGTVLRKWFRSSIAFQLAMESENGYAYFDLYIDIDFNSLEDSKKEDS